jgi:hypothetical protein
MGITLDPNTSQLFLHGGHGGFGFSEHGHIEEGEVLVGLNVWSGTFIDSVQPLYSRIQPGGMSPVVREGQRYGGRGGNVTRLYRPNHVVTGLTLRHEQVVDQIAVVWCEWTTEGVKPSPIQSRLIGGLGGRPITVATDEGEVAVGVFGASGWYVDRISLITCNYKVTA